jgi:AcrR family transcriptional regulator
MVDTEVKNLIVGSATKYFSKYGFYKTTMDEIAKNIHKAKASFIIILEARKSFLTKF